MSKDSANSVVREKMLMHIFLADIYKYVWTHDYIENFEVLFSEVDNHGYDIAISINNKLRYLQFKGKKKPKGNVDLNTRLIDKGGWIVLSVFDDTKKEEIKISYCYYKTSNESLKLKIGKHKKPNKDREKKERNNIRIVPFKVFSNEIKIDELIKELFDL